MNREADEKLRQAVRDWLEASPAAAACLMVESLEGQPPVWLLVGTTEEIRAAVPRPAVKDHVLREVVNQLRDIALQFHATGQLRERLRAALDPLLK